MNLGLIGRGGNVPDRTVSGIVTVCVVLFSELITRGVSIVDFVENCNCLYYVKMNRFSHVQKHKETYIYIDR